MKKNIRKSLKTGTGNRGEQGVTLIEAAIAVLLLGGVVLTMVLSLSGGAMAVNVNDTEVTAQGIARTQMEYVKAYPYDADAVTYPIVTAPAKYDITVTVAAVPDTNTDIQKVTVDVARGGNTILTVEDYKVNR